MLKQQTKLTQTSRTGMCAICTPEKKQAVELNYSGSHLLQLATLHNTACFEVKLIFSRHLFHTVIEYTLVIALIFKKIYNGMN